MPTVRLSSLLALLAPAIAHAQWTYVNSGSTASLRGLSLVRGGVAWASGTHGTVLWSNDGGKTWNANPVPGADSLDLRSVHALNDGAGYAASAGDADKGFAKIFATGDAGRHWHQQYSTAIKGVFLDAIAFWDVRHGIALSDPVDSAFFLLTTNDGGRTWTRIPAKNLPRVLAGEAAFAASGSSLVLNGESEVWIGTGGGGRARVFHSKDRGATWSVVETPIHAAGQGAGIFSLAFLDAKRGVAVGGDYSKPSLAATSVAITQDGGMTWAAAKAPPAAYLSGVAFAGSAAKLVAVGTIGTFVSSDSGQTWAHSDTLALNAVRFIGTWGVAVGPRGRIAFTEAP